MTTQTFDAVISANSDVTFIPFEHFTLSTFGDTDVVLVWRFGKLETNQKKEKCFDKLETRCTSEGVTTAPDDCFLVWTTRCGGTNVIEKESFITESETTKGVKFTVPFKKQGLRNDFKLVVKTGENYTILAHGRIYIR